MLIKRWIASAVLLCGISIAQGAGDPLRGIVCGEGNKIPDGYVPPLMSNGELSMIVDPTCGMRGHRYAGMKPEVYWAGRRDSAPCYNLLPFGTFNYNITVDGRTCEWPDSWEQELNVHRAVMRSSARYNEGIRIESEFFVPLSRSMIACRRILISTSNVPRQVTVQYLYHAPIHPRIIGSWSWDQENFRAIYTCRTYGYRLTGASISVFCGPGEKVVYTPKTDVSILSLSETVTLQPGERKTLTFYVHYADTMEEKEPPHIALRHTSAWLKENGFSGLLAEHEKAWDEYYAASSITVPEPKIQRMIDVDQYHLRANATRWSFPVGIFPSHWHGRFFGWDEMFCHQGLVATGHFATSRRCPDFRKSILPIALKRARHYNLTGKYGARYVWETCETGAEEGSPLGFWLDHIFHNSNIARSAWVQYLYSDDLSYLRETGYPVLMECARYFRSNWVYEDSSGMCYIGKCTDLERLGPARNRPFMTTCGAIYSMRAAADACDILKTNQTEAVDFRKTADRLVESLPHNDGAYVAYLNCKEPSVATLGGLFPYPIFGKDDALQREAAVRFVRNGRAAGNMYPVGKKICPWYSGKMAVAMTLLEDADEPIRMLREAADVTGLFGETFEINEPGVVVMHPWFSTAAGNCLYAMCQMLLCDAGGETRLAMGIPSSWLDYAFRLPAYGGIQIDAKVEGGRFTKLTLTPRYPERAHSVTLVFRDALADSLPVTMTGVKKKQKDGKTYFSLTADKTWNFVK